MLVRPEISLKGVVLFVGLAAATCAYACFVAPAIGFIAFGVIEHGSFPSPSGFVSGYVTALIMIALPALLVSVAVSGIVIGYARTRGRGFTLARWLGELSVLGPVAAVASCLLFIETGLAIDGGDWAAMVITCLVAGLISSAILIPVWWVGALIAEDLDQM